jgi:trimeric autotransporter adhesin
VPGRRMASEATVAARRRRRNQKRITVGIAVAVVALGVGVGVAAAQPSSGSDYRTSDATTGGAVRTLTVSGTVEPVNQAQAAFQVGGSVAAVDVAVGQHVTAGQTLATLDTSSLQEQLSLAQANLGTAQAKLSQDESGESSSSSSSSASTGQSSSSQAQTAAASTGESAVVLTADLISTGSGSPTGSGHPSGSTGGGSSGTGNLQQAQQAVLKAQHTADLDLQSAAAALASAERTCAASSQSGGSGSPTTPTTTTPTTTTPTTTTPTTTTPTTTTSTTTGTSGSGGQPSGNSSACAAALQTAMASQQQVSRDQQNVQSAETALAQILSSQSASASKASPSSASNASNASKSGASKSFSSSSGSTSTPTTAASNSAAQLASDQATIDSDQANLISAQQSLDNGTLTAPISGSVAAIDLSVGQSVSAGSSSATITIIDPGSYETTSSLTSSQVDEVATGDSVQVTVDGQSGVLNGTVTQVGPVIPGSSGYTYPLVVDLAAGSISPNTTVAGSTAQVAIDIAQADHVVVVPTSAVHTTTAGHPYVITLQSGHEVNSNVKVGVVGDVYTQITSGLSAGTPVVLADKSQPVPSSSSNSTSTLRGFGGGGFPTGFPTGGAGFARSGLG